MNGPIGEGEAEEDEGKTFIIELAFKVEVRALEFPDAIANDFVTKVKNKILSNRETMTLLGLRPEVYEVYIEED